MNKLAREQKLNSRSSLDVTSSSCIGLTGRNRNLTSLTFLHGSLLEHILRDSTFCDSNRDGSIQVSVKLRTEARGEETSRVKREK